MTATKSLSWYALVFAFMVILAPSSEAQITVDGKVMDSKNKPVGGVDVAIYVPGNKDAITSQKSHKETGEYCFSNLKLSDAFDIVYTHSQYETSSVSRLADQDNQHISKTVYRKGEPKPLTAVHERFLSVRRFAFLASAIDNQAGRVTFISRFVEFGIWRGLDQKIDGMTSEKISDGMRKLLETEQRDTLSLRSMLQ